MSNKRNKRNTKASKRQLKERNQARNMAKNIERFNAERVRVSKLEDQNSRA